MTVDLSEVHREAAERARRFVTEAILPFATLIDEAQTTPAHVLHALRMNGWLGAALPARWGGGGLDPVAYGLVVEHFGWACSSTRTLLTVHNMAAQVILRFGSSEQRERWLPPLCSGEKIIAFALTETDAGSDATGIETEAQARPGEYRVSGMKIWCSYGLAADLYLVFAKCEGKPLALVIERESPGLSVEPMRDAFGTRGSMLACLRLDGVLVPASHRIGSVGAGVNFVANSALDHGRFSVAWGAVGIIRACLDACVAYASERRQGGVILAQHQLIRRRLTDALLAHTTARALCVRSGKLRMAADPRAASETSLAKYHACEAALRVANDAIALHGANGCSPKFPVSRYLRDATVTNIIEGTREIHQVALATYALQRPYLDD